MPNRLTGFSPGFSASSNTTTAVEMGGRTRQAAAVLPAAETLEKILRYETALERQLFRAMNQLERLQRRRQGEHIPAPVTMEIATRL